jgi:hypothetical protein
MLDKFSYSPKHYSPKAAKKVLSFSFDSGDEYELPTWSSNPQSADDELGCRSPRSSRSQYVFTAKPRSGGRYPLAVFAFCLLGLTLYTNARSSLRLALAEVSDLIALSQRLNHQVKTAEHDVRQLQREFVALDQMEQQKEDLELEESVRRKAAAFANPKVVKEMQAVQQKLRDSSDRAQRLKEQVQEVSRADVISKYGDGVKRVKFELLFPGEEGLGGPTTFVIEMASLDLMPHSIFMFLEMVSFGLLDGTSFIMNALHVLKAAPLPYDYSPADEKSAAFKELGLQSVAFREYSPLYPHTKYTVGFAADGSPSFYINTDDNTEIHQGDPCFAKVVSGFDTIKRLESSPTRNGIWFERRIGIKKATVLQ